MTTTPKPDDSTSGTLTVSWHPNAVQHAIDAATDIVLADDFGPDQVARIAGRPLSWQDLACLLDAARAAVESPEPPPSPVTVGEEDLREGELWTILDWSLWGNGLGGELREAMADTMVAALTREQREQAEACIQSWHERRGPSMAVGVGTQLERERDEARALLAERDAEVRLPTELAEREPSPVDLVEGARVVAALLPALGEGIARSIANGTSDGDAMSMVRTAALALTSERVGHRRLLEQTRSQRRLDAARARKLRERHEAELAAARQRFEDVRDELGKQLAVRDRHISDLTARVAALRAAQRKTDQEDS